MSLRWIRTATGVNVLVKGESKLIPVDHQHYEAILAGLKAGDESVLNLIDELKRKINDFSGVDFEILGGELLFRGKPYHNEVLTEKILNMIERGFDAAPLVRFLEKVEQNPNPDSVRMLWDFMQNAGLAIADDGDILGFKYVDSVANMEAGPKKDALVAQGAIYTDNYSHTFNMSPGKICEMPRSRVVISDNVCAGAGLHVGTYQYAKGATYSVMVKVNPADVVSVPSAEAHKMRVCRYQVLDRFDESQVDDNGLNQPVFKIDGTKLTASDYSKSRTVNTLPPAGECDHESAEHWDNTDDFEDYEDDWEEDDTDLDDDDEDEDWDEDDNDVQEDEEDGGDFRQANSPYGY